MKASGMTDSPFKDMKQTDDIKRFVQATLGCGCPEEVFRSVDIARNVPLNSFITLSARIVVGNRLLIYIADAGSAGCVEEHLPVLLAAGRKERDRLGLNRFRLVLAAEEPGSLRDGAEKLFRELRGKDEKAHLHVIPKSEILFTTED